MPSNHRKCKCPVEVICAHKVKAHRIKAENVCVEENLTVKGTIFATEYPILLRQSDFASGTYRIKTPGTYTLVEDIVFNPPYGSASKRVDTPLNGFWFAIITVECDNVVINGNNHKFTVASSYVAANLVGSFVDILLGNNQFTGGLFGAAQAKYPDSTAYIAANNVLVKNINVVGASSHFGIMANNSNKIYIDNCNISDCQVANTYLQSVDMSSITNCNFSGSTTPITVNMEQVQLFLMRQQYAQLIANNVPGAAAQLAALNAYVLANPGRFNPAPQAFPTSLYGLFVVTGPTALFPFPMTANTIQISSAFAAGESSKNVMVNNCSFSNFTSEFNELVDIGTNIPLGMPIGAVPPPILTSWLLVTFGLFGSIQWKDAFNGSTFQPNAFLQSLVFIMKYVWTTSPGFAGLIPLYPTNSLTIFDSILTSNAAVFYANAAPITSCQSDGTAAKGLFGARIIGAVNFSMNNIQMSNFNANGPEPIIPSSLPGYSSLAATQPITRSRGNDAWFVSLEVCKNMTLSNFDMDGLTTAHGYAFGVHSAGDDANITITSSTIQNMSAPNTIVTDTMDMADVNGFTVDNNIGGIILQNLMTHNLTGGGTVTPFAAPSTMISVTNCFSS